MTFSFGGSSNNNSFSFGSKPAESKPASSGFSFGSTNPTTSTTTSGFSFGSTKPAETKPASGFSFGSTSASKPATSGFSFGGTNSTTTNNTSFSFNNVTAKPTENANKPEQPVAGLGGAEPKSILKPTENKAETKEKTEEKKENIMQTKIPKEIEEDVKNLEAHIKKQLEFSKKINTSSNQSSLEKVAAMIKKQSNQVIELVSQTRQLSSDVNGLIELLRNTRSNANIAENTNNIPLNMQFENTAPIGFFWHQTERFYHSISEYGKQLNDIEAIIGMNTNVSNFAIPSGTDLVDFLDRYQQSFVQIASAYFMVHNSMQEIKNLYMMFRADNYPNKKPLEFKVAEINTGLKETKLPSLPKQAKMDEEPKPFDEYNNHVLATICRSTITKQLAQATTAQPAQSGGLFGSSTNNTSSGFSFGNNNNNTKSGFSFGGGTNTTSGTSGFSFGNTASKPATTGFSFGNTSTKPETSGFSFGNSSTGLPFV